MDAGPYEFYSDFNAGHFTGVHPDELAAHAEWLTAPSYLGFHYLMGLRNEIADEKDISLYEARKRINNRACKALGISQAELIYPHKYTNAQVAEALQRAENLVTLEELADMLHVGKRTLENIPVKQRPKPVTPRRGRIPQRYSLDDWRPLLRERLPEPYRVYIAKVSIRESVT